ncbi:MAG: hypothetical protein VKP72_09285 [bacterium]|nr:hypothetical protein [bacterium]
MSGLLDTLQSRLAPTGGRIVLPDGPGGTWCLAACLRGHGLPGQSRVLGLHVDPDGSWTLGGATLEDDVAAEMPRIQEPWQVPASAEGWIAAWSRGELPFETLATGLASDAWDDALDQALPLTPEDWHGGSVEQPYFLSELGLRAVYREWIDGQECGWGMTSVVGLTPSSEGTRVLIEQADSRGDRWRFNVLVTREGVAAEVRGSCDDLVVQDWIWRFPIEPRHWDEQQGPHGACMEIARERSRIVTEAGTFDGCITMSARGEASAAEHWYHPRLGLVRSVFVDADGREGRRDLVELQRLDLSCQLPG